MYGRRADEQENPNEVAGRRFAIAPATEVALGRPPSPQYFQRPKSQLLGRKSYTGARHANGTFLPLRHPTQIELCEFG